MATPDPAALPSNVRVIEAGSPGATPAMVLHYTNNTQAQVETDGYFNPVRDWLHVGDQLRVSFDVDGTPGSRGYVVATIPDGGDVTITADATT
jgi:hypothetical protein